MQGLNKIKNKLKNDIIEDKFRVSKITLQNIKFDIIDVLKRHTKLDLNSIKFNIKLTSNNEYLIELKARVKNIY